MTSENMEFSMAAIDVTLDCDLKLNTIEKFPNLAKDEIARISLIAFDDKDSPLLKYSQYFWVEINDNNKFYAAAPDNKELLAKIIRQYGEPKVRFATVVVRYVTDKNGIIIKNADGSCNFNYYVWLIGTDKWDALKSMHSEWNLFGRDIIVKLDGKSDIKFQNVILQPAQDCAWKNHPEASAIKEQGRALYETSIMKFLAKKFTDEELSIKLGWGEAPATTNPVNPFNQLPQGNTPQAQITQQAGTTQENPFSKIVKPS
jgi:hypothetical protein